VRRSAISDAYKKITKRLALLTSQNEIYTDKMTSIMKNIDSSRL
jgi:hypothetical protein